MVILERFSLPGRRYVRNGSGANPRQFSLQGTNTYLLGTGSPRLLIDTAQGLPPWRASLGTVLASESTAISAALLTHHHHDHVGGIPDLLALSPATVLRKHTPAAGQLPIADGQEFAVPGATLRALHTPGHTHDHISFLLLEENALFTGDTVLGHGTSVFEDLAAYMRSLARLQELNAGRLYPAHGAVVEDGARKLAEYVRHRKLRENQIVKVLTQQRDNAAQDGGTSSMDIVKTIYRDVGVELHKAAEGGTVQVLEKLEGEGKVVRKEADGVVTWVLKEPPRL